MKGSINTGHSGNTYIIAFHRESRTDNFMFFQRLVPGNDYFFQSLGIFFQGNFVRNLFGIYDYFL